MTKLISTALAGLATVSVIAATGVVGVASAAAADTVRTQSLGGLDPRLRVDGSTIADVKVTGTHGPTAGSLNTWSACENYATVINETIASGLKDLHGGDMSGAGEKFGEAVKLLDEGEQVGCDFA